MQWCGFFLRLKAAIAVGVAKGHHAAIAQRNEEIARAIADQPLENLLVVAVLKGSFSQQAIQPVALLLAATPPTLVAIAAFRLF